MAIDITVIEAELERNVAATAAKLEDLKAARTLLTDTPRGLSTILNTARRLESPTRVHGDFRKTVLNIVSGADGPVNVADIVARSEGHITHEERYHVGTALAALNNAGLLQRVRKGYYEKK
jgi:hypothetical protein